MALGCIQIFYQKYSHVGDVRRRLTPTRSLSTSCNENNIFLEDFTNLHRIADSAYYNILH